MAKYAVNNEGVSALRQLSTRVSNCCESLNGLIADLKNACGDKGQVLGPHYASVEEALETIQAEVNKAKEPSISVSQTLLDIADSYEEIIENDKVKQSNQQKEAGKTGSFFTRLFGGGKNGSGGARSFGGYEVDEHGFVHGNHHQEFLRDWEGFDPGAFETTMFDGDEPIESVDPSSIEGINIRQYDIDNPGAFWSQHLTAGTKETFVEVASKIPTVKAELDSGRSMSDLLADEELGTCTYVYFDPTNITQVIKHDGFYEFQSNGRHRVLAARELGINIPVKVIGTRRRKQ